METFEDTIREALHLIAVASEGDLKGVAETIAIPAPEIAKAEGKGKLGLQRTIRRHLDSDELADSPDGGKAVWVQVVDLLEGVTRVEVLEKEATTEEKEEKPTKKTEPSTAGPAKEEVAHSKTPALAAWRKEFKIVGQIGEPGQKDRLSFVSLAHQVESGVKKGFSKEEIIEAVVRSVVPGLRLRSYLEGRDNLSLPDLRRILRAHFREKDATAVFQELSTAAQQSRETPHDFVLRVLDLKQKVIFASQEAGAGVTYDPNQVQRMALRSISTGIANESIQVEMRPKLLDEKITDEELLEALTSAVERDSERMQKLKPKSTRVSSIEPKETKDHTQLTRPPKSPTMASPGLDMKELAASIQAIVKAEIQAIRAADQPSSSRPRRERGCPDCRKAGKGDTCSHCFRCGSQDHYLRGCRAKRTPAQGNGQRLPEGDSQ